MTVKQLKLPYQFRAINIVFFQCVLFIIMSSMAMILSAQDSFISEVYFSTEPTEQEAIELAGPTDSSLDGWQLLLYNGVTGLVYDNHIFDATAIFPFTTTFPDGIDYGAYVKYYPTNNLLNDVGHGIALVDPMGTVQQFISYGSSFVAMNGAAAGLLSEDIGFMIFNSTESKSAQPTCKGSTYACDEPDYWRYEERENLGKLEYKHFICGAIQKAEQAQGDPEDLYYDRFGNSYSQEELIKQVQESQPLQHCHNEYDNFNVTITPWTNEDTEETFPTDQQEEVICAVFSYLDGILQSSPTGGRANIIVRFDPNLIGSNIAGRATPEFRLQCGVGYSMVQEQLNSAITDLDATLPHGRVDINPSLNYNTDLSPTPVIGNNEIDLYTIVLHEMLHVLGFASQIGASGNTLNSFYTLWDLHLLRAENVPMVNATDNPNECCLDYEFNTTAFPSMPANIMEGCGDVIFDLPNFPAINAEYNTSGGVDDALAANMLSHLDINCEDEGEDYVMHYDIVPGPTHPDGFPNARRTLTATEMSILCELGYSVTNENNSGNFCQPQCFLLVQDDGAFFISQDIEFITLDAILANDVFTNIENVEITLNETCGNIGNLSFSLIQGPDVETPGIEITLNDTPLGAYELCYSVQGCDEELCDEASIQLIVGDKIDPTICPEDGCNLVNYGDFEMFPEGTNQYYSSFIEPFNNFISIYTGNTVSDNSPDIYSSSNGNQVLSWYQRISTSDRENILFPLCQPVPADCHISTSFDMCIYSGNFGPLADVETISIFGLNSLPVNNQLPSTITCDGILEDDNGNQVGICLESEVLMSCRNEGFSALSSVNEFTSGNFSSYTINSINASPIDINYLFFISNSSQNAVVYLMDNVVVQTDCQNIIEVAAIPESTCIGEQITLDVKVQLTGPEGFPSSDMTIEAILPNITGVSLSDNNMDFVDGIATVNGLTPPNDCENLSLMLDIGDNFQEGNTLTIAFEVIASDACLAGNANPEIELVLEECCPDQPISGFTTEGGDCNPQVTFTSIDQNTEWTHTWTFGDGEGSTDINPTHTYNEAGIYTVTHTVSNDCGTNTTQGTIEILNSFITADFTFQQEECETNIQFFSTETTEVEHFWDFDGDNIADSDEASPTWDFLTEGTYPVTHTVTGECGTETSTQTITIIECVEFCEDEEGIRMGEDENSFTVVHQAIIDGTLNESGTSTEQTFIVNGTLIIDVDYTFTRCHFKMGPSAAIIIKQNTKLTIEGNGGLSGQPFNSTISACDYLWKGINADEDAILDLRGTYVADAQYAIRAYHGTDLNLVYNTFDRNFVGLYIPPTNFNQGLTNFTAFFNRFNCTNTLNPVHPTIELLPISDGVEILDWAYAGLWLNDLSAFSMGSAGSPSASNVFDNLANGIIGRNAELDIYSPIFKRMQKSTSNYVIRGHGIYATGAGHRLRMRGMGQYSNLPSFETCDLGIFTENMRVEISENNMQDISKGIDVHLAQSVSINENQINCSFFGINLIDASKAEKVTIQHNDIDLGFPPYTGFHLYGIGVQNSTVPGQVKEPNKTINNNQLRGYNVRFAMIILSGAEDLFVTANDINLTNNPNFPNPPNTPEPPINFGDGLQLTNCHDITARDNTIYRSDIANLSDLNGDRFNGIKAINSTNCLYCCNDVSNINYGVAFIGKASSPTYLVGTDFDGHYQGLRLEAEAVIGEQPHYGNCWASDIGYQDAGAVNTGTIEQIQASIFTVKNEACLFPPNSPDAEGGWFTIDFDPNATTHACESDPLCDNIERKRKINSRDQAIVSGQTATSENGMNWELHRGLYQKLDIGLEEGEVPTAFQDYQAQLFHTAIGDFRTIEKGIEDLFEIDIDIDNNLSNLNLQIKDKLDQISLKDIAIANDTNADISSLQAEKRLLYTEVLDLVNLRQATLASIQEARISTSEDLWALNNNILALKIYEINEKTVNAIYLKTIAQSKTTLSATQITLLNAIAQQCPNEGGFAVYRARALLSLVGYYDFDDSLCSEVGLRHQQQQSAYSQQDLLVYPNPASQHIQIEWEKAFNSDIPLEILDIYGRVVERRQLVAKTKEIQISLNQQSSGIYFIRIKAPDGTILSQKLILNK